MLPCKYFIPYVLIPDPPFIRFTIRKYYYYYIWSIYIYNLNLNYILAHMKFIKYISYIKNITRNIYIYILYIYTG